VVLCLYFLASAAVPQRATSSVPTEVSILEGLRVGKASTPLLSMTFNRLNKTSYWTKDIRLCNPRLRQPGLHFAGEIWKHCLFLQFSPGQTIATCQRNISQHCWAQHVVRVWPPCCDVLRHVGCCWLKFENGQIWANYTQHIATRWPNACSMLRYVTIGMLWSFRWGFRPTVHSCQ